MAIKKLCNKVGCGNLIPRNQNPPYCDEHLPQIKKYKSQLRRQKRSKYDDFYDSSSWKHMRDYILSKNNYICEECRKPADTVHHIIYLKLDEGWNLRLKESNLMAVCRGCHNKIHREKGGSHG